MWQMSLALWMDTAYDPYRCTDHRVGWWTLFRALSLRLIAELHARTCYEAQNKPIYTVRYIKFRAGRTRNGFAGGQAGPRRVGRRKLVVAANGNDSIPPEPDR